MKIYSQLFSAQLENRTSDYSSGTRGRIWMRTDTSPVVVKFDNGSAIKTLVDTDSSQTFTNKTWNGAVVAEIYGGTNQSTYTTGDILYASASNTLSKLAKGVNGQFLKIGASIPEWAAVASTLGVKSKANADSPYTILSGDDVILVDTSGGAVTLNLPASSGGGKVYRIKKTTSDFSAVTVARNGSDTITDTAASLTSTLLHTLGEEITIIDASSGVWHVLERRIPSIWTSYTPTLGAGYGTTSNLDAFWKRVGDSISLKIKFTTGTTAASASTMTLPTGTIDSTKGAGTAVYGFLAQAANQVALITLIGTASASTVSMGFQTATSDGLTTQNGSILGNNRDVAFIATNIPISGWNA